MTASVHEAPIVEFPEVGDVLVCAAFKNGHRDDCECVIVPHVGQVKSTQVASGPGPERLLDESRARAEFVVVDAHVFRDQWDEEHRFVCQRLNEDGSFNPQGEYIDFTRCSEDEEKKVLAVYTHNGLSPEAARERLAKHMIVRDTPIYKIRTMLRKENVSFE